eukprot:CAMPEP_0173399936 /NCGR_PEP_ID=MMETSP1356-20130122/46397_1 /TAXON_ID=77927 ORGANISM="Hemiselmis virescens, Strain PCC157" /NCGR_SAMPLE_ID=MMETSP1356 /ASSEMBLY_ACC=CAM_ASM_000847 /LENGTH=400 /DNA_ID=CAMNT_0014359753 /DNA_START=238 /DNA_END=1437 /DNA_ORIENTATION=+
MCQGRRPHMEDSFDFGMMRGAITFCGVYDGHAGTRAVNMLKDKLVASLDAGLNGMDFSRTAEVDRVIKRVVCQLDDVFVQEAKEHKWHDGSTATTVMIKGTQLVVANVGDSRTILCRLGQAVPLSSDHKPSRPDERDRIIAAGGTISTMGVLRVNGILATSRTIGDGSMKVKNYITCEPEMTHHEIQPGDEYVILASDGLWDVISNQQAAELACKCGSPSVAAKTLIDEALKKGANDNITVAVVDLRGAYSNSAPPSVGNSGTSLSCPTSDLGSQANVRPAVTALNSPNPDHQGWMLKQQSKALFGMQQWQKRWFTLSRTAENATYDGSMHSNWHTGNYILQYFPDEATASKKQIGNKPIFLDPSYQARRETVHDSAGRLCMSVRDMYSGKVIVLACPAS